MTLTGEKKIFFLTFSLLICLHLYLIWQQRLFPFLDLPNHLAAATVLRYFGDITNHFAGYYQVDLFLQPNVFHLLFCSSPMFPSVETANAVFMSIYVILLPLAVLMLIIRLNGHIWYALFSFLFLYNFNVGFGFTGFFFALPLLLLFVYLLLDYPGDNPFARRSLVGALLLLLYFVHILIMLFALFLFFTVGWYLGRHALKKVFAEYLLVLPALLLLFAWWYLYHDSYSSRLWSFLGDYYLNEYIPTFFKRLQFLGFDNYRLFPRFTGYTISWLISLAVLIPSFCALVHNRKSLRAYLTSTATTVIFIFTGSALLCFLILPSGLPEQGYLYQRFAVIFILATVTAGSILCSKKTNRFRTVTLIILCLVHLALYFDYFTRFDRDNAGFTPSFFAVVQPDKRLAGLIADNSFRGHPTYLHFPNYNIIWNQGLSTSCITKYHFGVIRRGLSDTTLPVYDELMHETDYILGNYADVDYLLVKGRLPADYNTFISRFKLVKTSGKWFIYKKLLPVDS